MGDVVTSSVAKIPVVVLCGPTAVGKTALACRVAELFPAEVVSADSRQVYRGMDIGTAKPTADEQRRIPHHLIDVVDPDSNFTAADFVAHGQRLIGQIHDRGALPLVVGGTGLYIRALTAGLIDAPPADEPLRQRLYQDEAEQGEGTLYRRLQQIDPLQAATIHPRNLVRVIRALEVFESSGQPLSTWQNQHGFAEEPYRLLKIYLDLPRTELDERINQRVEAMFADGLIDEVAALLAAGFNPQHKALKTIGYREVLQYLAGELDRAGAIARIQTETRRYARRQMTWFRKETAIISFDSLRETDNILNAIKCFRMKKGSGYG